MTVVVFDEMKNRRQQIVHLLNAKGYSVKPCFASGDFMDILDRNSIDKIIMDVDSWRHSRAIFDYFNVSRKLQNIPIIFYNAPETFVSIHDRSQGIQDKVYQKTCAADAIVSEL